MRMYDIIEKKKHNIELSKDEIEWLISNYTNDYIFDYQMSAFLMAVYFNGMTENEIFNMTMAMAKSGDVLDLSLINGIKVDKHSTGGVGDKTTLIIAPIVAACGGKVAKMSGKGLGFTGGTIDKLESINGFKTNISINEFIENVNDIGVSVVGQTGNLTPADKKIYALRDVTATVDSIPLIASSIMSKKIAAGSDGILLDVKVGSGAFMKDIKKAEELADIMIKIGKKANKKVSALITNMDEPLGCAIGNALEVEEAIEVLKGNKKGDLYEVCIELASRMLVMSECGTLEECKDMVIEAINSFKAYDKFEEMVKRQNGAITEFKKAKYSYEVLAKKEGYIGGIECCECGRASVVLEAGRENKDSIIDYQAGIIIDKKTSDKVSIGDRLAIVYTNNKEKIKEASEILETAFTIVPEKIERKPIILGEK